MKTAAAITILAISLTALPARAQSTGLYQNAVVARFDPQDMALMRAAVDAALRDPKDGSAHEWKNAKTSASGAVTSGKATTVGRAACREVSVLNRFKNDQGEAVYKFCQNPAGAWKLAP